MRAIYVMSYCSVMTALLLATACSDDISPAMDATISDAGQADASPPDSGPQAPSIVSFTASASEVTIGSGVTLNYEVRTATAVTLTRESSTGTSLILSGPAFMRTIETGPLNEAQTFRLKAHGAGETIERTVSVDVTVPEVTILDFSATPNPAEPGEEVTVRWQTRGADEVRVRDGGTVLGSTRTDVGQGELRLIASEAGTKLVLEASNAWRTRTQALELLSRGAAQVFDFAVTPPVFTALRATSVLSWQARGETVELLANDTAIAGVPQVLTASIAVEITEPTLFTLTVTGAQRTARVRRIATNNAAREAEPNDVLVAAQTIEGGVLGTLDRAGDQDFYRLQLAQGGHLFLDLWSMLGACPVGVGIRLLSAGGVELLERDAGETTPCPRLDPATDVDVRGLPAGEYFVVVDGLTPDFEYGLATFVLAGRCGDGLLEPSASESCDDGGSAAGDGCSPTCEVELTDSFTFPGPDIVRAGALAAGELDYYRLIITSSAAVAFETSVPAPGECSADTVIALLDADYQVIASNDDAVGVCAALEARLFQAGVYYLRVQAFDPALAIPAYTLSAHAVIAACGDDILGPGETCDDGNRAGGDGCSAACTIERLQAPGSIVFDIPPGAIRMVEVEVTMPGQSITATTSDGLGGCAVDTRLILARGPQYLGYENGGTGCAHLNPRDQRWVSNLEPGIYRVIVVNDGATGGSVTLDVGLIDAECGNGRLETLAGELCDDGNLIEDDGCDTMCLRSLGGTVMGPGGPPATFSGNIMTPGDDVSFGIVLSSPGNLFAEVGVPVMGQCVGGDSVIELYDANLAFLTWNDDFNGSLCSQLDPISDPLARLPAGAYIVTVRSYSFQPMMFEVQIELRDVGCGNYVPEPLEECDDGNLVAGDGCSETCLFEP